MKTDLAAILAILIQAKKADKFCLLIIGKNEDGGSGVQLTVTAK